MAKSASRSFTPVFPAIPLQIDEVQEKTRRARVAQRAVVVLEFDLVHLAELREGV